MNFLNDNLRQKYSHEWNETHIVFYFQTRLQEAILDEKFLCNIA